MFYRDTKHIIHYTTMPLIVDKRITSILNEGSYQEVSNFLLNEATFRIGEHNFRLLEVEYYDLDDPYTHKDVSQYTPGRWYFHRKGGTYKGLDVTCQHGSFLLRAVENLDTGEITEGPSLLVDLILAETGLNDVNELRAKYTYPGQKNINIRFIPSVIKEETILTCRRVGLRHQPERDQHWQARLRFLIKPEYLKKGRKLLIEDLKADGMSRDEIIALTKCSPRSVI